MQALGGIPGVLGDQAAAKKTAAVEDAGGSSAGLPTCPGIVYMYTTTGMDAGCGFGDAGGCGGVCATPAIKPG